MLDGKNYLQQQPELREKLILLMKKLEKTPTDVSKETGIARVTVVSFINGRNANWLVLVKLEKWIERYDK